jgi:hypothetical protein
MQMTKSKLEWLEYDLLESYPHVIHGTFTRHGGASQEPCATLNVSENTSDSPEAVTANREQVRKALGVAKVVYPQQVHGVIVQRITARNQGLIPQADALFTTEKNIGLAIQHADCQAAIFYDPVHEAIGVAHCGWRGSAQNIYARLIGAMQREIGTQSHNLIVCISPSLGPDHAEFINYKQELPKEMWEFGTGKKSNHFDFWAISKSQLLKMGIIEKNIEIVEICTQCNTDDYFSYRSAKDTGRNATVVALKS